MRSAVAAVNAAAASADQEKPPLAATGLTELIEEIGFDDFIDRTPQDRPFAPTMEHGFGLCFRRKEYGAFDSYIQDHGIRREATREQMQNVPSQDLLWVESIGVVDMGGGVGATIPLAQFNGGYIALYGGLYGSVMLRYRRLELEVCGQRDKELSLPTNAEKASRMKAGTEIEFIGQGKVNTGAGLMVGAGAAVGQFSVGAALVSPVTLEGVKEYSLTVTAMDGKGKVRVIMRRLDSKQETAQVMAVAGLISPGFNGPDLTSDGTLNLLVGNTSTVKSTNLMVEYTSAGLEFSAAHLARTTVLSAFDIDLNSQDGAKAYDDLLRLSPRRAFELAKDGKSGVRLLTVNEKQNDVSASAAFNFFGEKLFLWENVDSDRKGKMVRRDGTQLDYKEKIFEKRSRNALTGTKNISWEAASFKDGGKTPELYFHLNYQRSDYEFVKPRFNRFLGFAKALGVDKQDFENSSGKSFSEICERYSHANKVDTKVDLFFSNAGIKNIEHCDQEHAVNLYIREVLRLNTKYAGFPLRACGTVDKRLQDLMVKYAALRSPSNFFGIIDFGKTQGLREQYSELTGRSIEFDSKLFAKAREFGEQVHHLKNARVHGEADHFFSRLGKVRGFRFMATIAALRAVAGEENTYVHELSLTGLGFRIGYDSQLAPKGPRDLIYEGLTAT